MSVFLTSAVGSLQSLTAAKASGNYPCTVGLTSVFEVDFRLGMLAEIVQPKKVGRRSFSS
jgi:hypothetical protein